MGLRQKNLTLGRIFGICKRVAGPCFMGTCRDSQTYRDGNSIAPPKRKAGKDKQWTSAQFYRGLSRTQTSKLTFRPHQAAPYTQRHMEATSPDGLQKERDSKPSKPRRRQPSRLCLP